MGKIAARNVIDTRCVDRQRCDDGSREVGAPDERHSVSLQAGFGVEQERLAGETRLVNPTK